MTVGLLDIYILYPGSRKPCGEIPCLQTFMHKISSNDNVVAVTSL